MDISFIALNRIFEEHMAKDRKVFDEIHAKGSAVVSFGRKLSDDELLQKLGLMGVVCDRETFSELCKGFLSAEELSTHLIRKRGLELNDLEDDWLWVCLTILWERWSPDHPSLEMIDDTMQEGYRRVEENDAPGAVEIWLRAWKDILAIMGSRGMKTLPEFDAVFRGSQCMFNWVQDLETELLNSCWETGAHCDDRIRFCREVIELVPEDDLMIENMRRGIGDSYVRLGNMQKVDALFDAWLKSDPQWGWGWIGWSDGYGLFTRGENNYLRAEEILKQGLAVSEVRDRIDIQDRLMRLYQELGRDGESEKIRRDLARLSGDDEDDQSDLDWSGEEPEITGAGDLTIKFRDEGVPPEFMKNLPEGDGHIRKKTGRNQPCTCGSGKKFKKCCGK